MIWAFSLVTRRGGRGEEQKQRRSLRGGEETARSRVSYVKEV